jgi:hypothetical protein
MACVGCTRWLVVPWLVIYLLNILFLIGVALGKLPPKTPNQIKHLVPKPVLLVNLSTMK